MTHETPLELAVEGGRLCGTLATPAADGPWPAVLLVAGSGPTDRDGNNPLLPEPCDNFRRLARALAARGFASLRYDKRGVGESVFPGLSEESLRFDHLVDDAVALADLLGADERFAEVVLFGHSEGALVAALAAAETFPQLLVCASGAGERASELMRRQMQAVLPEDIARPALATLAALERQEAVDEVDDMLALLFRPSVQPYLMSWFRHDPAQALSALPTPLLLLHGAADAQVPARHARTLHEARPDATLCIVDAMDHLLAIAGDYDAGARRAAEETAAAFARTFASDAATSARP